MNNEIFKKKKQLIKKITQNKGIAIIRMKIKFNKKIN